MKKKISIFLLNNDRTRGLNLEKFNRKLRVNTDTYRLQTLAGFLCAHSLKSTLSFKWKVMLGIISDAYVPHNITTFPYVPNYTTTVACVQTYAYTFMHTNHVHL